MPGPPTRTSMPAEPQAATSAPALYRLLAWLSPAFPVGAFSYSHGLEAAVAGGAVSDRSSLEGWIAAIIAQGSGRIDADILRDTYHAAAAGDAAALAGAHRRGAAFRATAELALESAQQGAAFLAAYDAAWSAAITNPSPPNNSAPSPPNGGREREEVCHAAAFGAAAARGRIALGDALLGYLQSFAANLVSTGIRLGIVGQTDGQRIVAALEPVVTAAAAAAMSRDEADFGGATFAAELASMAHETLYTRLFRS